MQGPVAEGCLLDLLRLALEPALGVGVGKELGQIFIEVEIVADDGAHRRLHRLVAVPFGEMRLEFFLGLARLDEKEAGGAAIRRGRAKLQEIDQLVQQRVGNFAGKRIMRPRVAEQLV